MPGANIQNFIAQSKSIKDEQYLAERRKQIGDEIFNQVMSSSRPGSAVPNTVGYTPIKQPELISFPPVMQANFNSGQKSSRGESRGREEQQNFFQKN